MLWHPFIVLNSKAVKRGFPAAWLLIRFGFHFSIAGDIPWKMGSGCKMTGGTLNNPKIIA